VTIPTELDGGKVLGTAEVRPSSDTGPARRIAVGEITYPPIRFLAITQVDNQAFFLFYCDEHWNIIWDGWHLTIEEALSQARSEYRDVRFAGLDEPY
jgi:hypothetical protein